MSSLEPFSDSTLLSAIELWETTFEATFNPWKNETQNAVYAPGRVNLIGEHTDYNEGFVFPLALNLRTFVVGSLEIREIPQKDRDFEFEESSLVSNAGDENVSSSNLAKFVATSRMLSKKEGPFWSNYVKGCFFEYLQNNIDEDRFYFVAKIAISTSVPLGGGLSSSASLEVATYQFLQSFEEFYNKTSPVLFKGKNNLTVSNSARAEICQKVEHEWADVNCGIMDQYISSCGKEGHALLIDCRSQTGEPVGINSPDVVIVVTNSNVKHSLTGSEYPDRVRQCFEVVKHIQRVRENSGISSTMKEPKISHLRDIDIQMLDVFRKEIDETAYRRAKHVIEEDKRTLTAVEALKKNDFDTVGKLMVESHNSLRDLYEVSCQELDFLVAHAVKVPGVYGSRMTGGGFGGCIVSLVKKESAEELMNTLENVYKQTFGKYPTSFVTTPGSGANIISEWKSVKRNKKKKTILGKVMSEKLGFSANEGQFFSVGLGVGILAAVCVITILSIQKSRKKN